MSKYPYRLKKKVVQDYIDGKAGVRVLCKRYGLPAHSLIQSWISVYKEYGFEGLKAGKKKKKYSFEFKLHVVELYLTSDISLQQLAVKVGIKDGGLVQAWVSAYRDAGPDALRPKPKGKIKNMDREKAEKELKKNPESAKLLEQLKNENLKLRIENAYLKELRRLRLEEEALLKEKRELSTASEENSN